MKTENIYKNNSSHEENNKLIAKFMGYHQLNIDDLNEEGIEDFLVYASLEEAIKDYPYRDIKTYYGDDIEEFVFIDEPLYHKSWDYLMPVVEKIESCKEVDELLIRYEDGRPHYMMEIISAYKDFPSVTTAPNETKIGAVYNAVVKFIRKYNSEGGKHD